MTDGIACPDCGTKGRKVEPLTLESLLNGGAKTRLNGASDFRFCKSEACDVAYYHEGGDIRFVAADLRVPIFQKSTDPSRFVCYCFEHRVADIEDEVARTGTSLVPDRITEKCRQGLDRCAEMNPQGACCLGNVRQVVKAATRDSAAAVRSPPHDGQALPDCCAPATTEDESREAFRVLPTEALASAAAGAPPRERNAGLWSAGGAVVGAALASACCWLPLLLIGVGASAAGVSGFFEAYRAYFLGGTALLLGAGFYFVYVRKPKCAPGEACEVPNQKLVRLNKIMLWVATVFVVAFATFPNYVGVLLGGTDGPTPAAAASLSSRTYAIDGMTCEGCASHLEQALTDLDGVASADVSYPDKLARVYLMDGTEVSDAEVIGAVKAAGYQARLQQGGP